MTASYRQQVVLINLIFQNRISRNITKCELGRFSLRQSHIKMAVQCQIVHICDMGDLRRDIRNTSFELGVCTC